ncbi:MAG: ABC transporter ATP-binding protein [Candidatus Omnitrophica bacterium]|nr:ABC transporter ATP-binding protein [Candidatus Omnitrophota bacterium]
MDSILKVENLYGGYKNNEVIKNVSFELNEKDFLGIIGPNASGKSTLLRLITKVLSPTKGKIFWQGKDLKKISLKEFSQNVAFVAQETKIYFSFSVWEIVFMGRIPYLKRLQSETKKDFSIVENALFLTETLDLRNKPFEALSSGERQRVLIARALAQEPKLLILDEPTAHLDIGHQIHIMDLIKKLNQTKNVTVLIVLHDLNLASQYCERLILLDKGRIVKQGDISEVLTYKDLETVYRTPVLVKENPLTGRPFIILFSESQKE